jgi:hypothetical protein
LWQILELPVRSFTHNYSVDGISLTTCIDAACHVYFTANTCVLVVGWGPARGEGGGEGSESGEFEIVPFALQIPFLRSVLNPSIGRYFPSKHLTTEFYAQYM